MAFMKQVLPSDQRFVCFAVHIPQIWWVQHVCSAACGMLLVAPEHACTTLGNGLDKSFWCCDAGLTSLDISADSTVAITGSEDMTAKISNIHTGKVLGTFVGRPSQMANSIAFKTSTSVKSAVVCA